MSRPELSYRGTRVLVTGVPGCRIEYAADAGPNKRSYRVSFDKIRHALPGFKPEWDARRRAEELYRAYVAAKLDNDSFEGPTYQRIGHIRQLMADGILTSDLRRPRASAA